MGVITERKVRHYYGLDADKATIPGGALATGDIFNATNSGYIYQWNGAGWEWPVPGLSILTTKINNLAVTEAKIGALAVTNGKIGLLAVDTAQLQALAVEEAKIGALAVTNGKIGLLAVDTPQLQDLAVEEAKIGPLAVSVAKLKADAVETIKIKDANVTLAKLAPDAVCCFGHRLLHIQDQKSAGVEGGTFTTGAWRTRDLNLVLTNEISGASLASDQITLPAGTYFILAGASGYFVGRHKTKLRNVSDGADALIGSNAFANASGIQSRSFTTGRFTIVAEKVFELQHRSSSTEALDGYGVASNFAVVEVYADVLIWKVA